MKKILISGLFALLAGSAIAQDPVDGRVDFIEPTGNNLKSAVWQGKPYNLTAKNMKESGLFETTLTFLKDGKIKNQFKVTEFGNYPIPIAAIAFDSNGQPQAGLEATYAILPFEDYADSVLIKASFLLLEEIDNPKEGQPKFSPLDHSRSSLIPVGKEVMLTKWGNQEVRVLVNRVE